MVARGYDEAAVTRRVSVQRNHWQCFRTVAFAQFVSDGPAKRSRVRSPALQRKRRYWLEGTFDCAFTWRQVRSCCHAKGSRLGLRHVFVPYALPRSSVFSMAGASVAGTKSEYLRTPTPNNSVKVTAGPLREPSAPYASRYVLPVVDD